MSYLPKHPGLLAYRLDFTHDGNPTVFRWRYYAPSMDVARDYAVRHLSAEFVTYQIVELVQED